MDARVVLRLQSVFPFTHPHGRPRYSGSAAALQEEAAKAAFSSPTASSLPFRLRLIGGIYRPSGGGGLHRSWFRTIFSRRRHDSPSWFETGTPHVRSRGGNSGSRQRFYQGRCLTHHAGPCAVSRSLPAWPLRPSAFSGPSGGAELAAYPCGMLQSSSREFCTGADPHR